MEIPVIMKKYLFLLFAAILPLKMMANYPDTLKANYVVPPTPDYSEQTKAPAGYKPVYISHYARHGARFMGFEKEYLDVLDPLSEAAKNDNLTEEGKAFFEKCNNFYVDYTKDRAGELTPIGWNQHKEIARSIYNGYPEFFRKHPEVQAHSTYFQRCIVSMSSFCIELQKCDSKLDIFTQSNNREYARLLNEKGECRLIEPGWNLSTTAFYKNLDSDKILRRLFKDTSGIEKKAELVKYIYNYIKDADCVAPGNGLYESGVLTQEELEFCYKAECLLFFRRCWVKRRLAIPVVEGIIEDANNALSSGEARLDLRFGHDVVIMPILCLLNIDNFGDLPSGPDQAFKTIRAWRIPMACTMLFVFYQNKQGHTLVKILLDGKETSLPLKAVEGPYYDWNELQAYFKATVQS